MSNISLCVGPAPKPAKMKEVVNSIIATQKQVILKNLEEQLLIMRLENSTLKSKLKEMSADLNSNFSSIIKENSEMDEVIVKELKELSRIKKKVKKEHEKLKLDKEKKLEEMEKIKETLELKIETLRYKKEFKHMEIHAKKVQEAERKRNIVSWDNNKEKIKTDHENKLKSTIETFAVMILFDKRNAILYIAD